MDIKDIREYAEEYEVEIKKLDPKEGKQFENVLSDIQKEAYKSERYIVKAVNEGGFNCTEVDLIDLLTYVKTNMPEVWNSI